MKIKQLLVAFSLLGLLGASMLTFAVAGGQGFYMGVQAGYTKANYDLSTILDKHFDKDGYAGRVYLGYQINSFLGLESGLAMISGADLPKDFGDVKTTYWDFLLKVGTPFGDSGFRSDLKAGGVHIKSSFDAHEPAKSLGLDDVKSWKIRPIAGASLSYYLNQNIAVDVFYSHVFGEPKSESFKALTADMATVGLGLMFLGS